MVANFPSTPSLGDTYTVGEYQYNWNGSSWEILPGRLNELVNSVSVTATSAVVDLSKGNYHKISTVDYSNLSITFTNIKQGSSKWFLELNTLASIGWDLATATYVTGFSVNSQDINPTSIFFKPDGTKMYMLGVTNNRVYQYTLATPWDVSTATYDNVSFLVSQDSVPRDIFFKPDGTKMYVVGPGNDRVYQYTLSTPWEISSTSYDNISFLVSGQDTTGRSGDFKPDGTKMYILGATNDRVFQYTLSTPWNVSTATYDNVSFLVTNQEGDPHCIFFKPDGTKMYMAGLINDRVYQYTLSTPWNVSTATYDSVSVSASTSTTDIYFKPNGTRMYIMALENKAVWQYSVSDTISAALWPSNIIWKNNTTPVLYSDQNLFLEFYTNDGGTTIYGVERYNREKTV